MNYIENKHKMMIRNRTKEQFHKQNICQKCGHQGYTEFHHLKYDNESPSNFIVLCAICHRNDIKRQHKEDYLKNIMLLFENG